MMENKISKRLQTIATYITPGTLFADIGSDHAYLPCYVCLRDENAQAIAGEVKEGPYLKANSTVQAYGLDKRVDVRFGDGLDVIHDYDAVKEIVIAGMGGSLINQIIEKGKEKLQTVNRMILQPNNQADQVRKNLLKTTFSLVDEEIIKENEQIYEILIAQKNAPLTIYNDDVELEKQIMFGPVLMKRKSPVFKQKWQSEHTKLTKVVQQIKSANNQKYKSKLDLLKQQIQWIEEVLT